MDYSTTSLRTRGSALLESILGVALIGLFLVILLGSITYLETSALRAKEHAKATLLAFEGLEAARSIRDQDFGLLTDGTFGLAHENGTWELAGVNDASDEFTRTITIAHENASTTHVNVVVLWGVGEQESQVELETYLTDWHTN